MLNRNLKWAICLLIVLLSGVLSFADELPPVDIEVSYGSNERKIESFDESYTAWIEHEVRLSTAKNGLQPLKSELAAIEDDIEKKVKARKVATGVVTLIAGKQLRASAGVIPMLNLIDGDGLYDLELQRIDKYAEIHSQNELISDAFLDRDKFYSEYVKRWDHEQTHLSSQSNSAPPRVDTTALQDMIVPVPPLGAGCQNMCGVFWYDIGYQVYYDSFDYSIFAGGIMADISELSDLARSEHHKTCKGTASCGDDYWTCWGGTARHKLRTCKKQALGWDSATSSWKTVTCKIQYRNCGNRGGRCFSGVTGVLDNGKHDDTPPSNSSNTSNSKSGIITSGSSSASAGGSVTVGLATTTAFSSVYWYVAGPGDSGLGSHVETDTGGSSSTTESFTYTFPSDATEGTWTITAYIYNYSDSSTYETSYTVNVSGSRYTVSDNTPNCPDCTSDCSSPCSCTNSGTCGGTVTDNTPNCPDCTSHCSSPCGCSNSGTCNGSVYTPPSTPSTPPTPPPTPSPPTTVACGGASYTGCRESVSSRTEHHVPSCSNCGSSYWTCSPNASRHTDVLTCKRTDCDATLTRCQNGPGLCTKGRYHWL